MFSVAHRHLETASHGSADEPGARTATSQREAALDAELVRRCNGGDDSAFDEIVRRHRAKIYGLVRGCLPDRSDVEEVVDDTFIRAYRGLRRFRGESSLGTWLYHIALNLSRNRYWFLLRRRHLAGSLDVPVPAGSDTTLADLVRSDGPDPAQELDRQEFVTVLAKCLDHLPPRQREILVLRTRLDASYAKIATELGLNVGTVKSRIARARQQLRKSVNAIAPEAPCRSTPAF